MKKILSVLLICVVVVACNKDDESPSKTNLLTGGTQKGWYVYSITPDEDEDCTSGDDDTYTFFADGKFQYNHGAIVEAGDCSDLANFDGTWAFTNSEGKIVITAVKETGGDTFDEPLEIANATITSISADKLVLTQGVTSIELRKK